MSVGRLARTGSEQTYSCHFRESSWHTLASDRDWWGSTKKTVCNSLRTGNSHGNVRFCAGRNELDAMEKQVHLGFEPRTFHMFSHSIVCSFHPGTQPQSGHQPTLKHSRSTNFCKRVSDGRRFMKFQMILLSGFWQKRGPHHHHGVWISSSLP